MQKAKSRRHVNAARARWRAAEIRADAERARGIEPPPLPQDSRDVIFLDLRSYGDKLLRIEPRTGYTAVRCFDHEAGQLLHSATMKQILHWAADRLAHVRGARATDRGHYGYTARDEADAAAC